MQSHRDHVLRDADHTGDLFRCESVDVAHGDCFPIEVWKLGYAHTYRFEEPLLVESFFCFAHASFGHLGFKVPRIALEKFVERGLLGFVVLVDDEVVEYPIEETLELLHLTAAVYVVPRFEEGLLGQFERSIAIAQAEECVPEQGIGIRGERFQAGLLLLRPFSGVCHIRRAGYWYLTSPAYAYFKVESAGFLGKPADCLRLRELGPIEANPGSD